MIAVLVSTYIYIYIYIYIYGKHCKIQSDHKALYDYPEEYRKCPHKTPTYTSQSTFIRHQNRIRPLKNLPLSDMLSGYPLPENN